MPFLILTNEVIQLPVSTIGGLQNIDTTPIQDGVVVNCISHGFFRYEKFSLEPYDGSIIVKPNNVTTCGRWIRLADEYTTKISETNSPIIYAGNTGWGRGASPSYKNLQTTDIDGTFLNAQTFLRTDGSFWNENALVGQIAWAYNSVSTQSPNGPALIVQNSPTTFYCTASLDGTNYHCDKVAITPYLTFAVAGKNSNIWFTQPDLGSVFDGQNIWSKTSTNYYKTDKVTLLSSVINFDLEISTAYIESLKPLFSGIEYDGNSILIAPFNYNKILQIDPRTSNVTSHLILSSYGENLFSDIFYDGSFLWLAPFGNFPIVKINPQTMENFLHLHGQPNPCFSSIVFDGVDLWFVPLAGNDLIKINKQTEDMTVYSNVSLSTVTYKFTCGFFDGESIWLRHAGSFQKLDLRANSLSDLIYTKNSFSLTTTGSVLFDGFNGICVVDEGQKFAVPRFGNQRSIQDRLCLGIIEEPTAELGDLYNISEPYICDGNLWNVINCGLYRRQNSATKTSSDINNIIRNASQNNSFWYKQLANKWRSDSMVADNLIFAGNNSNNNGILDKKFEFETNLNGATVTSYTFNFSSYYGATPITITANALVGQKLFQYNNEFSGVNPTIISNTTYSFTVSTLLALVDGTTSHAQIGLYNIIESLYNSGASVAESFKGAIYDGRYVWAIPYNNSFFVRLDPITASIVTYLHYQTTYAFAGAVFDGENIWCVPYDSENILKINPRSNDIATFSYSSLLKKFFGGTFDGANIWFAPYDSQEIVKLNPTDAKITTISHTQYSLTTYGAFKGAIYDGKSIWLTPSNSQYVLQINPNTDAITSYKYTRTNEPTAANAFSGAVFDGESIWFIPDSTGFGKIVRLNPKANYFAWYDIPNAITSGTDNVYRGAVFDGKSIWFTPANNAYITKLDPFLAEQNRNDTNYLHNLGLYSFSAGVYDGNYIWLFPEAASMTTINMDNNTNIARLVSPEFSRSELGNKLPIIDGTHNIIGNITIKNGLVINVS